MEGAIDVNSCEDGPAALHRAAVSEALGVRARRRPRTEELPSCPTAVCDLVKVEREALTRDRGRRRMGMGMGGRGRVERAADV